MVLLICDNGIVLWRHYRHFYLFKQVLRIFKMIATGGFLTALECTKFVFGRGSAPDSTGELTALSQTPGWFKGAYY